MRERSCVVPECDGKAKSFFSFPKRIGLRTKWIRFIVSCDTRLKDFVPQPDSFVCMKHFSSNDFSNYMAFESGHCSKLCLNRDAIPRSKKAVLASLFDVSSLLSNFAPPAPLRTEELCSTPTSSKPLSNGCSLPSSKKVSVVIHHKCVCKKPKLTRNQSTQCDFFTLNKIENTRHKSTTTDGLWKSETAYTGNWHWYNDKIVIARSMLMMFVCLRILMICVYVYRIKFVVAVSK